MRILHIMAGAGNGGAELYSTDIMLSLHAAGVDQCVVMRDNAPRTAELTAAGLRMAPQILKWPFRALQRRRMRRLIATEKPDIIQCWMRRAAEITPRSAKSWSRVIGWFGDYEDLAYFGHCTDFIGVTEDLTAHMRKGGITAAKAAYIPTFPSVDASPALDRASLDTPADAKVLLTLSRLHQTKGLDTLIRCLPALPDCYLWVAGDGPLRAELEALAAGIGVAGRVKFLGWRTDRGALLRAADICVLPSRYEPFGTVILDAWSTRTALIACDSAGPKAYVKDGENGMLVAIDDVGGLTQAIRKVTEDDELRQTIIENGYGQFATGFTQEAVTRQYLAHYEAMIAGDHFNRYRKSWLHDKRHD